MPLPLSRQVSTAMAISRTHARTRADMNFVNFRAAKGRGTVNFGDEWEV